MLAPVLLVHPYQPMKTHKLIYLSSSTRYYSATIVQMSGVRNASVDIWLAAVTAFINFSFTIVGVLLVEKIGRRLLSLVSIAG